jgi:hypothetical protein
VEKCKSCLYAEVGDKKPLNTFDAFRQAAEDNPNAAYTWLDYLAKISTTDTLELFHRIPGERISSTAIDFAQEILKINRIRLLELRDILRLR